MAAPADAVSATDAKRRKPPTCNLKGSKTVLQNRNVRLFELRITDGKRLYGCLKRVGKRRRLTKAFDDGYTQSSDYGSIRLAGRFVAWQDIATDISCKADCPPGYNADSSSISVYDLARRRSRTFSGTPLNESLLVTRRGSLAWAQRSQTDTAVEVYAAEGRTARMLDRGNVDPDTLKVRGATLVWMKDGIERSAPFR